MGLLGIFLNVILAGNLVLASGTGIDLVLYREQRRGDGLVIFLQCLIFLTVTSLLFWLVYTFVLLPLELGQLWVLWGLLVLGGAKALLSAAAERLAPGSGPGTVLQRVLFSGSAYGNFFSSSIGFGFLCLVVLGQWDFLQLVVAAAGAGFGVGLVAWITFNIRQKLSLERLPRPARGEASYLLILGLLSLSFSFFDRMILVGFPS